MMYSSADDVYFHEDKLNHYKTNIFISFSKLKLSDFLGSSDIWSDTSWSLSLRSLQHNYQGEYVANTRCCHPLAASQSSFFRPFLPWWS